VDVEDTAGTAGAGEGQNPVRLTGPDSGALVAQDRGGTLGVLHNDFKNSRLGRVSRIIDNHKLEAVLSGTGQFRGWLNFDLRPIAIVKRLSDG